MRTPKSHRAMIEELAKAPPTTIYRLNKKTGFSTSTLHAAMKKLISARLVKKHNGGYNLTFKGIVKYFASRFDDPEFQKEDIRRVVAKCSQIDEYPLFSWHESFEEWLQKGFYDYVVSTSYIVNHLFESGTQIVFVKATKPVKRGERIQIRTPTVSLEEEETHWKKTFTTTFLNLILRKPKTELEKPKDQKIQAFIEQYYKEEVARRKKEITELNNTLRKLT